MFYWVTPVKKKLLGFETLELLPVLPFPNNFWILRPLGMNLDLHDHIWKRKNLKTSMQPKVCMIASKFLSKNLIKKFTNFFRKKQIGTCSRKQWRPPYVTKEISEMPSSGYTLQYIAICILINFAMYSSVYQVVSRHIIPKNSFSKINNDTKKHPPNLISETALIGKLRHTFLCLRV